MSAETPSVIRNNDANRLELHVDGDVAFTEFTLSPGEVVFVRTFVPESLRGRGLAGHLIQAGLKMARDEKRLVTPKCAAFAAYMTKTPETHALLSAAGRAQLGV